MSYWDWEGLKIIAPIVGLIILCLVAIYKIDEHKANERERLVSQCLADGKKEYECRSMFRSTAGAVPVIIPMYMGR